jgi:RHS repeat-associated protein
LASGASVTNRARRIAAVAAAILVAIAPHAAVASIGCIYVYYPQSPQGPCGENGCGVGCAQGAYTYTYNYERYDCDTGEETASCVDGGNGHTEWHNANLPNAPANRPAQCNNPWSAVFIDCAAAPEPKQCTLPINNGWSTVGDPVDLATGGLEQTPTDLDLGRGLAFRRHYASDQNTTTAMGKGWQHSLDWKLHYRLSRSSDPFLELVMVERPLAMNTAFTRMSFAGPVAGTGSWQGAVHGAGGLSGSESSGFTYTDDDGTRVRFDRVAAETFRLAEIQPPGGSAITVSYAGDTTTFATGGATLEITHYPTGHGNEGQVATVTGGGQTWTYTYSTTDWLLTATGPDLSTPETSTDEVVWTYGYSSSSATYALLDEVTRTAGGSTRTLGAWTFNPQDRVATVDEAALDQKLSLTYTTDEGDVTATTVKDAPAPPASAQTLATFTCDGGRITGVGTNDVGGPGVELPFAAASLSTAPALTGAPDKLWKVITDRNGHKTWLEGHDARGRPGRVVEGWIDANASGAFEPSDGFARWRDFTYHPSLEGPLTVTEPSVSSTAGSRVVTDDYDADLDATPNEEPTDRLHRLLVQGWTLDALGNQVAFTDTTVYGYDGAGRLTQIQGPRSAQLTEIDYDPATGSRSAVRRYVDGAGSSFLQWTFSNFDAQGNPGAVTDPNGRATLFTYDGRGRVLTAKPPCEVDPCTGADDTTVAFQYDVDGNLTKVTFPNDTAGGPVWLEFGYDPAKPDLLLSIEDSKGNAIVYEYEKGRATSEKRYANHGTPQSALKGEATFRYYKPNEPPGNTSNGRLWRAFNPLFASDNVFSEFEHDGKGNPKSVRDENGKQDVLLYDVLDRLRKIQQVRAATYETEFAYDALSNVTAVTDAAGKTTDLLHDDRGNLVETVSPDTGRTRFVYDAAGNLVTKVEDAPASGAGGRITSYAYDGLNRLTGIDLPNDADWTFSYDTDAAKNQKGRLAQVANGPLTSSATVATQLEYTRRGDIAVERTIVDGFTYTVAYQYDAAGNRISHQAPTNSTVQTSYAGLRPSALSIIAGPRTESVGDLVWYPFGPRESMTIPPHDGTARTVQSTRTYNLRGQIEEVLVQRHLEIPPVKLLHRSYTYDYTAGAPGPNDPGPNLDQVIDHLEATESRFFFYDELDRLAKSTELDGDVLHQYGYDAVGNRTSKLGLAGTTTYSYETIATEPTNRLDAATGDTETGDFTHDAYGNRIYDGTHAAGPRTLVYDDSNRLREVRDAEDAEFARYTYDAFGRRIKKVVDEKTTLFFYDTEGRLIEEVQKFDGSQNDRARLYVFVEDELIGIVDRLKEAGQSAWLSPVAIGIDDDLVPAFLVLLLSLAAGIGAGAATRRWPVGIATATTGAATLLLCAGVPPLPAFKWVHVDPLGTPLSVTTSPANWSASNPARVIWHARYEPFGRVESITTETDAGGNPAVVLNVRFPGQYEDAETGWYFNMHRTYDPSTGRYLEVDPLGLTGRSTYEYAFSNPLRYVDPLGLIEMNWFPPGSPEFNNASQIGSGYPVYGFAGHGNPSSVSDPQENTVGPLGLATAIGRDPAWGGRPVVLYSCNTGRGNDPFAQLLADALGVLVLAPDNFGWLPPPSNPTRFLVAPPIGGECCNENLGSDCCREFFDGVGEKPQPDLGNPGRWRVFVPRGNPTIGAGR